MSNSSLVNYTKLSPNCTKPRKNQIKKITIHHMAGNLSIETCGSIFANSNRQASSNYGIGTDGRVGMYVEEKNRSWCSSNAANDNQAVTIEVANDGGANTNWHVSDTALAKLIDLCVDICKRNNIPKLTYDGTKNGTLTTHDMFIATTCPGPYLKSKMSYIADEVNKRLEQPVTTKIDVIYQAYDNVSKKWWSEITNYNTTNYNGYAGCLGHALGGIRVKLSNGGKIYIRSHVKGQKWLSWISKWDNTSNGYSGLYGKAIDGIQVKSDVGTVVYRVHLKGGSWLSWISKVDNTYYGYAGIYGKEIDAIQMYIK